MVNVYDDISLEAHPIMLVVGNGASTSTPQARVQAQVPVSGTPVGNMVYVTQPVNPQPCLAISSPMSVSHALLAPLTKMKVLQCSADHVYMLAKWIAQDCSPSASKATLAQFLEKHKERNFDICFIACEAYKGICVDVDRVGKKCHFQ
ncbi:uncharacterized protein LOC143531007 [Bidens hawaiensis]|uniref:uncharacterized protein LOC143531007 n=1 Tax=Bidens hawaiensis TaxID=980011 RepID=UPI004049D7A0